MNKERLFQALVGTATIYNHSINEIALNLYAQILGDYPIEVIESAIAQHLKDPERGKFWPKPADIIYQIEGGDNTKEIALVAYRSFIDTIRNIGGWKSVQFEDPNISATVAFLGGWVELCSLQRSELSKMKHQFCEIYTNIATTTDNKRNPVAHGMTMLHNDEKHPEFVNKPVFIPDANKALRNKALLTKEDDVKWLTTDE